MKRGGETEQLVFVVASWPMLFFTQTATHPCPFPRTHTLHRSRAVVPKTICRHRLARMACLIDPRGQENDAPLLRRFFVSPPSTPPRWGSRDVQADAARGEGSNAIKRREHRKLPQALSVHVGTYMPLLCVRRRPLVREGRGHLMLVLGLVGALLTFFYFYILAHPFPFPSPHKHTHLQLTRIFAAKL
jgi:hypothetical protein